MLIQKRLKSDQRLLTSLNALDNTPDSIDQFLGPRELSSRQRMVLAVINDAFECLIGNGTVDGVSGAMMMREKGRVAGEAFDWISCDLQTPFSFIWCCYSLGWEHPESIRKYMLKSANYELINLSRIVKFTIWRKEKRGDIKSFRGVMEVKGRRIDVGEYPTRKAAVHALHREFSLRGGVKWATQ